MGVYLITEYASRGDVFGELDRRGGSMTEADAVRQVIAPFLSALQVCFVRVVCARAVVECCVCCLGVCLGRGHLLHQNSPGCRFMFPLPLAVCAPFLTGAVASCCCCCCC